MSTDKLTKKQQKEMRREGAAEATRRANDPHPVIIRKIEPTDFLNVLPLVHNAMKDTKYKQTPTTAKEEDIMEEQSVLNPMPSFDDKGRVVSLTSAGMFLKCSNEVKTFDLI
jgi:hypothetical protein